MSTRTTGSTSDEAKVVDDHDAYRIALYYRYISIPNPQAHVEFQQKLCERLALKGRIRVAREGINGVLSGTMKNLRLYEHEATQHLRPQLQMTNYDSPLQAKTPSPSDNKKPQVDDFQLDVKYCELRRELSVKDQLFPCLCIRVTDQVVSLVESNKKEHSHSHSLRRRSNTQSQPSIMMSARDQEIQDMYYAVLSSCQHVQTEMEQPKGQSVPHLSPDEWNQQVMAAAENPNNRVVFLDCRNVYESNIGTFAAPHCTTVLTNTRKYSELPTALHELQETLQGSSHIFSFCTGGIRCERATLFLQELLSRQEHDSKNKTSPKLYQLQGGIQRYLEKAHRKDATTDFFVGKNFVFDPRRTDPMCHIDQIVGKCCVCARPWDDYDNGKAPSERNEARCCHCRILLLVCETCRTRYHCASTNKKNNNDTKNGKPLLYCGGTTCCQRSEPQEVPYQAFSQSS